MAFTYFFRGAQIMETLIEHALPALTGQCHIRIWDAGCAHGPEPYTLAMLLRERMSEMNTLEQLTGTIRTTAQIMV